MSHGFEPCFVIVRLIFFCFYPRASFVPVVSMATPLGFKCQTSSLVRVGSSVQSWVLRRSILGLETTSPSFLLLYSLSSPSFP